MSVCIKRYKAANRCRVDQIHAEKLQEPLCLLSLLVEPVFEVDLPEGARHIDVVIDEGELHLVALADDTRPCCRRFLYCAFDGHHLPEELPFIGKVSLEGGYSCYVFDYELHPTGC